MTKHSSLSKCALFAGSMTCAAVAVSLVAQMPTRLIWNVSASVPTGLYALSSSEQLRRGDLVAIAPPEPLASWLVQRGYIGHNAPLLKRVEALPGARVCRSGARVSVNDVTRAMARERDRVGRPLPQWSGCRIVAKDELFLLNANRWASLDGRYFGPLPQRSVLGRATPVWTREEK
ncbi:conjugative transfer signal peptidase TraF [Sphingosinicella rhizophila]|uniref:Conjugative transfer signal peptidase TraF n=1 Tax=Sphingosinicella rhizophila TaxID=3050082 RepID=A0ABU3QBN7_9SPHN|nr:conjugative transfer signal peptidase TraF [Sphingosinicella sp. GR2756]MDT9600418.1 conjugative transfer signal peptidase TraF [Sphingosinicella sp. GR2756]